MRKSTKAFAYAALCGAALSAAPLFAQVDSSNEYVVVTGSRISNSLSSIPISLQQQPSPPVIGLKRQADSAVRNIEIISDSLEEGMRRREVQAMLFAAIDRAKSQGLSLVTGQFELVEVTRANWQDQFPGLLGKTNLGDDDADDYDDDNQDAAAYEDDGRTMTIRLRLKTKLDGSIGNAQQKIDSFAKSVPPTGRSLIKQIGGVALTIINPEQYRNEIYGKIATGAKQAGSFYEPVFGLEVTGLDEAIAWSQVSNTDVFLYIPYRFTVRK